MTFKQKVAAYFPRAYFTGLFAVLFVNFNRDHDPLVLAIIGIVLTPNSTEKRKP